MIKNMNTSPEKDERDVKGAGGAILESIFAEDTAKRAERTARAEEAAANNPSKELFDFTKLSEIYSVRGLTGSEPTDPEIVTEFMQRYYVDMPEVTTIEEFADRLYQLDANETN